MAVISDALATSLTVYTFTDSRSFYPAVETPLGCNNNNIFQKFLEVIIPFKGECFIPVLKLPQTLLCLQDWFNSENPVKKMKFSYPLYIGGTEERKTADSIIQSINRCIPSLRLSHIKTTKGLDYYGGQGVIFDEHWNPFVLCGFKANINVEAKSIKVIKPVCYVSPKVFTNNDILSRAIVKKVIPFLTTHPISRPNILYSSFNTSYISENFENVLVVVRDISQYFITPILCRDVENMDNRLWDFLEEKINDLI